ncbi:aminotransferase class IV family protein [Rhizobium sp. ARZ01]|uniref:aminotransferase class IV family protein n=1 Tax=Rhizobium sp. ARZ01 TaxID=2769313 RepID=UPI0017824181|nr:aminotransferase class IV family protein [Rhizobium sp. ARZ01]MBD9373493.1 aminotransferase class IV family protein [Rhizobium sp. ARZ01]
MDISLIETLRWEPGDGFVRLDRHLARLQRSAEALSMVGAGGAERALTKAVTAPPLPTPSPEVEASPLRVRLELFADGRIEVTTAPFKPLAADARWTVKVATTRLSSTDPLLRHKTSRRAAYEAARAEFPAVDADEVVLLNERGEACEGTITSIFLDDGTGIMKTPPLACGLLAGVLREELLETGRATEQPLQVEDLRRHPFYVGNSLRGLIPARLA